MTYFNGNPYADEITKWAHNDCLPADQFEEMPLGGGETHRVQIHPWHWAPIWGAPMPCNYCNGRVA